MSKGETEQVLGDEGGVTQGNEAKFQAEAIRGGVGAGKTQQTQLEPQERQAQTITEEQARALLAQERLETEQRLKKANAQKKKIITLVIAAAVFLAVVAIVVGVLAGNRKTETGEDGAKRPESGKVESSASGTLGKTETAEEAGRRLYARYEVKDGQKFYASELRNRELYGEDFGPGRLEVVLNNLALESCAATRENGGLLERYGERWETLSSGEKDTAQRCYAGAKVREMYRRLFGEEVTLSAEKFGAGEGKEALYSEGFWQYAEKEDEFYNNLGGTDGLGKRVRALEGVETEGDKLYLFERVVSVNCRPDPRFDEAGNQYGGGSYCGVTVVAPSCGMAEFAWTGEDEGMSDEEIIERAKAKGIGLVRWIFEKTPEGDYVFRGMERAD